MSLGLTFNKRGEMPQGGERRTPFGAPKGKAMVLILRLDRKNFPQRLKNVLKLWCVFPLCE